MSDNPERRPMVSRWVAGLFLGLAASVIPAGSVSRPPRRVAAALANDWTTASLDMSQAFLGHPEKYKASSARSVK